MEIILASKSPRRVELLAKITKDFSVIPSEKEETFAEGTPPHTVVEMLAHQKADDIHSQHKNSCVIGADTIVVCDGEILGKPTNEQDARRMLRKISGKIHTVYTGVAVVTANTSKVFHNATQVKFLPLSDSKINEYIASGEPMDKAGAYGIQERGSLFVESISGDYFSVMGLPISQLALAMEEIGVNT